MIQRSYTIWAKNRDRLYESLSGPAIDVKCRCGESVIYESADDLPQDSVPCPAYEGSYHVYYDSTREGDVEVELAGDHLPAAHPDLATEDLLAYENIDLSDYEICVGDNGVVWSDDLNDAKLTGALAYVELCDDDTANQHMVESALCVMDRLVVYSRNYDQITKALINLRNHYTTAHIGAPIQHGLCDFIATPKVPAARETLLKTAEHLEKLGLDERATEVREAVKTLRR